MLRYFGCFQNYDKALESLKEAIKCLAKSSDTDTGEIVIHLFHHSHGHTQVGEGGAAGYLAEHV